MSDMCAHGYTIDCADCWRERCVELEAEMEAELAELSADYHGERLRADSFFDQLAALKEKARAAVNAPYDDILDMGLAQALRELGELL